MHVVCSYKYVYQVISFNYLLSCTCTDEQLIPIPPNNLQVSEEVDKRVGFFGHVILNISWDAPKSM